MSAVCEASRGGISLNGDSSVLLSSLREKRVATAEVLSGCRYPTMNDDKHTLEPVERGSSEIQVARGSLSGVLQSVA
jgi:hypothetical protein